MRLDLVEMEGDGALSARRLPVAVTLRVVRFSSRTPSRLEPPYAVAERRRSHAQYARRRQKLRLRHGDEGGEIARS